ncbi:MAG TPA: hypothetical protein ENI17_10450 [Pseudomonas xinjiangensis]|uniref:Type II secretion system protein L n=2 Tax=root TaxID=1 RepID=A0A7V1BNH9_9GAMM|nr:hypothetical protein [Halopseudomonas xinjiangensis]HEC48036.1 hypothetical protein [Halopseudomonas xinjiangensis]
MLIVLLPESMRTDIEEQISVSWWRMERGGTAQEKGSDTLADLHDRFAAEKIRALVPASAVTLHRVSIPVRRASAVRAALPFALEDHVSQELDELHFVAGPRRTDDRFAAAVVEHASMQHWQAMFLQAGWRLEALLPLTSLHADEVPAHAIRIQRSPWPGGVGQVIVTADDQEPVVVETELLGFWINRRLAERPESARNIEVAGLEVSALEPAEGVAVSQIAEDPSSTIHAALRRAMQPNPPFNLLVGPYTTGMRTPPWRKMRSVMIAAGVLLAVLMTQLTLEWITLANERDRLDAAIDDVFTSSMPNARLVDPVVQFEQVLAGSAASGTEGIGQLLYEVLAVSRNGGTAQIMQFRASPSEMEIELQLASFAELETVRANLSSKTGLRETLQGADSGENGVTARLKVARSGT